MNRILCVVLLAVVVNASAQNQFTIEEVIQRSQSQSPDFKISETRRENSYWAYRFQRTRYNPQVVMSTNNAGAVYNNSFSPIRQPDGSIQYLQVNQLNPGLNFSLEQPILWTGGTVSVNSNYNYFRDLQDKTHQWNGQVFNVRLEQPVFNYNDLKWAKLIQPIIFEESKRSYAESMQSIAREAASNFFGVLQAQVDLQIAEYNVANNDTIFKIEQGRFNIGTTSQDKLLQVELQLLRSRQAVAQAKLDLQRYSLQLRTFIGLRNGENFELVMPTELPSFEVNDDEALQHAKETRADYIAFERRKLQAEQEVARSKGNRYQVGLTGGFGVNNVGASVSDLYQNPARQQFVTLDFSVPLIDWGRRRAMMQNAYANKRLQDYLIAQNEIQFDQEVLTQVRLIETLKLQIDITKKSDEVAFERYNVAQNRYLIGKIDITNLNIALNEKDAAKRGYIQALREYWIAYYELRRLTLYDYVERKYLYNPFVKE